MRFLSAVLLASAIVAQSHGSVDAKEGRGVSFGERKFTVTSHPTLASFVDAKRSSDVKDDRNAKAKEGSMHISPKGKGQSQENLSSKSVSKKGPNSGQKQFDPRAKPSIPNFAAKSEKSSSDISRESPPEARSATGKQDASLRQFVGTQETHPGQKDALDTPSASKVANEAFSSRFGNSNAKFGRGRGGRGGSKFPSKKHFVPHSSQTAQTGSRQYSFPGNFIQAGSSQSKPQTRSFPGNVAHTSRAGSSKSQPQTRSARSSSQPQAPSFPGNFAQAFQSGSSRSQPQTGSASQADSQTQTRSFLGNFDSSQSHSQAQTPSFPSKVASIFEQFLAHIFQTKPADAPTEGLSQSQAGASRHSENSPMMNMMKNSQYARSDVSSPVSKAAEPQPSSRSASPQTRTRSAYSFSTPSASKDVAAPTQDHAYPFGPSFSKNAKKQGSRSKSAPPQMAGMHFPMMQTIDKKTVQSHSAPSTGKYGVASPLLARPTSPMSQQSSKSTSFGRAYPVDGPSSKSAPQMAGMHFPMMQTSDKKTVQSHSAPSTGKYGVASPLLARPTSPMSKESSKSTSFGRAYPVDGPSSKSAPQMAGMHFPMMQTSDKKTVQSHSAPSTGKYGVASPLPARPAFSPVSKATYSSAPNMRMPSAMTDKVDSRPTLPSFPGNFPSNFVTVDKVSVDLDKTKPTVQVDTRSAPATVKPDVKPVMVAEARFVGKAEDAKVEKPSVQVPSPTGQAHVSTSTSASKITQIQGKDTKSMIPLVPALRSFQPQPQAQASEKEAKEAKPQPNNGHKN